MRPPESLLRPTLPVVLAAFALILAADTTIALTDLPYPAVGFVDDPAHLATGILVLAVLSPRSRVFAASLLVASVAIDLDHLPDLLGSDVFTPGQPERPVTHSLFVMAALAGAAGLLLRSREVAAGVAVGLVTHFARDLGVGPGVPLLWPATGATAEVPYAVYALALTGCTGLAVSSVRRRERVPA